MSRPKSARVSVSILVPPAELELAKCLGQTGVVPVAVSAVLSKAVLLGLAQMQRESRVSEFRPAHQVEAVKTSLNAGTFGHSDIVGYLDIITQHQGKWGFEGVSFAAGDNWVRKNKGEKFFPLWSRCKAFYVENKSLFP